jgi:hypothetical protein
VADPRFPSDGRDVALLARGALVHLHEQGEVLGADGRRAVVEGVAARLAAMARHHACGEERRRTLLGWRDRLSSYVLAAQALDELDVHADAADQFLRRGLDELGAEAGERQFAAG